MKKTAPPKGLTPHQKAAARGDAIGDDDVMERAGRQALVEQQRAAKWDKYIKGVAAVKEPLRQILDAEVPKDRDAFAFLVNRGVARALECSTTAKEITDAVKAATWWYKVRYDVKDEEPYGGALGGGKDE